MDDFCVDNIDIESIDCNIDNLNVQNISNVDYKISNKTYRIEVDKPIDIFKYAIQNKNCILSAKWRCTQHFQGFSVNIFKHNIWMLMTREINENKVKNMILENFDRKPVKITVVNITMMVKLGVSIDLEDLHDSMCNFDLNDIFNGSVNEDLYFLDKQKFPALIAKPNKDKDLVLELYSTGAINVTGMKSNDEIDIAMEYIKLRIIPKIRGFQP